MNTDELTSTVNALYGLCMAHAGKIAALETVNGALVASIGMALPPLSAQISQNIDGLTPYHRESLEEESIDAFESALASVKANLRAQSGV